MSTNIKDVIAELDRISALVTRFCDIGDEIDELKEKNDRETREIYYEYRPELPASMPVFKTLQAEVEPFNSSHAKGIKIGLLFHISFVQACLIFELMVEVHYLFYRVCLSLMVLFLSIFAFVCLCIFEENLLFEVLYILISLQFLFALILSVLILIFLSHTE